MASGRRTAPPDSPRTIGVLQFGKLGDMILTTPLFNALKALFPGARLTVIAATTSALIPEHHPAVDDVVAAPRGLLGLPKLAIELRKRPFDLYIDPKDHRSRTSQMIADLVHASFSIGLPENAGRYRFDAPLSAPQPPGHYVDRMLAPLLALAPDERFERRPSLGIPSDAFRNADDQLNPGEHGAVAVNISAGDRSRYWGLENWERLVREISKRFNVAVMSSPHDRDHADEICATRREARPIRTESILEAAAVVARCRAVISPDTSIVHIASTFDLPTVGLYPRSDRNATIFGPLATPHRILMPAPDADFTSIPIESVLDAFRSILPR